MNGVRRLGAAAMACGLASAAPAEPPVLAFPVECRLGETCHIQNHFDRDPGPGFLDLMCGALVYDGHNGVDVALPDLVAMRAGVAVLAAAPGTVMGTRDGMPDVSFRDAAAPAVGGRECGNGVSIDHGGGWSTQYCHLAQGSVAVRPGAVVEAGQWLGLVGLSGQTEFPHLHLTLRRDGIAVDPFDPDAAGCGGEPEAALWAEPIPYVSTGLVAQGFLDRVPDWAEVREGGFGSHPGARGADLVLWGYAFGARPGDRMVLRIEGPQGLVLEEGEAMSRTQAIYYVARGQRAPEGGWPAGAYRGRVEIRRGERVMDAAEARVSLR